MLLPVNLTAASVDVDVLDFCPALSLPEPAAQPEEEHYGKSEVGLEEAFSRRLTLERGYCDVELLPGVRPFPSTHIEVKKKKGTGKKHNLPGQ